VFTARAGPTATVSATLKGFETMTATKDTTERDAKKRTSNGLGRIRLDDNSLNFAGHSKGDVLLVKLHATPKDGQLCAAFLPTGHLRIRRYYREPDGNIMLTRFQGDNLIQVFAPQALIVFGPVVGVEKGGAS
jgi:SOS-response transcriptional repressor LexA